MIAKLIYAFSDAMARPLTFTIVASAYIIAAVSGLLFDLGDHFMTNLNLSISILTLVIGQAVLVSTSRDSTAVHVKLDTLTQGQPGDDRTVGAEKHDEETLKEMKQEIEEKSHDRPV